MPGPLPSRWRQPLSPTRLDLSVQDNFTPGKRRAISITESAVQCVAAIAAILRHGLRDLTPTLSLELGVMVVAGLLALIGLLVVRYRASLARETFLHRQRFNLGLFALWFAIASALVVLGPDLLGFDPDTTRLSSFLAWSEMVILARGLFIGVGLTRGVTAGGINPAMLLVGSFALLITVGTLLLMLPKCRSADAPPLDWPDRLRVCAFTATSASCVTGLIVVPTGGPEAYWSRTGQTVILGLFQVGGLGIMTCGAFFALTTGRSLRLKEAATLRELFDSDQPVNVRRLVLTILAFTFGTELLGAVLISGLWPDLPPNERVFFSLFHSVSAFCNAGFDLTGESLLGQGGRWQVWGGIAGLIILGGIGFGTIYNLGHVAGEWMWGKPLSPFESSAIYQTRLEQFRPARVTVSTRLVLITTAMLLGLGTAWYFFFEATEGGTLADASVGRRLADSWFQAVTCRTAGYNAVELSELRPASKLFAIILMFIGGSPVSTAGGVKTTAIAVTVLSIATILRGRPRAEVFGRTLPEEIVRRSLVIVAIGMATVISLTLLLSAFEDDSQFKMIDLMFEATSACGTVGASTGITTDLTDASQYVLMAGMFLGRVGPLTLLLGLAGHRSVTAYQYPEERVTLG